MNLLKELTNINDNWLVEAAQPVEVIELTQFDGKEIPHAAWPKGVTYRGLNVFDLIYDARPATLTAAESVLKNSRSYSHVDFQEVYLGYDPKRDVFVQGYDGWISEQDEYGNGEDSNASPYITFQVRDGQVKVITKGLFMGSPDNLWYDRGAHGGLQAARYKFPDLIDIRLD